MYVKRNLFPESICHTKSSFFFFSHEFLQWSYVVDQFSKNCMREASGLKHTIPRNRTNQHEFYFSSSTLSPEYRKMWMWDRAKRENEAKRKQKNCLKRAMFFLRVRWLHQAQLLMLSLLIMHAEKRGKNGTVKWCLPASLVCLDKGK